VRGAYVNGVLTVARDTSLALAEKSVRNATRDDTWQWGTDRSSGGGGTVRVGPGWGGGAPRFDAGEVEVVIDGQHYFEVNGAWVTADGEPCPLVEEG
jgi:hypothetical protein